MPIHYRCPACEKLLSIATRKAGAEVPCPLCGEVSIVPTPDDTPEPEQEHQTETEQPAIPNSWHADRVRGTTGVGLTEETGHLEHEPLFDERFSATDDSASEHLEDEADDVTGDRTESDATEIGSNTTENPDGAEDAGGIQLRRASPDLGDLDLTSMVDVTFLLLIFFMVTASFSLQKTIELPKLNPDQKGAAQALTLEDLQANTIFVKIDEANQIFIDDEPAGAPEKLEDVLTQARLTTLRTEVAIDAHPDSLHDTVVQVIDASTGAGMQKIRIVSRTGTAE